MNGRQIETIIKKFDRLYSHRIQNPEINNAGCLTMPPMIDSNIKSFCKAIASKPPVYVNVVPLGGPGQCHLNAAKATKISGGEMVSGLAIWGVKGHAISAEYHSVWRDPDGELIDLTPNEDNSTRILFLEIGPFDSQLPDNKIWVAHNRECKICRFQRQREVWRNENILRPVRTDVIAKWEAAGLLNDGFVKDPVKVLCEMETAS